MVATSSLAGRRGCFGLASAALLLSGALASPLQGACPEGGAQGGDGGCAAPTAAAGGTSGAALLQKQAVVKHDLDAEDEVAVERAGVYHGSDCARRFGHGSAHPAACIVTENNRALLVKVYYGRSPGWDLPGGWHHRGEAPCETAEREVCEETGMSVRAVEKLQSNVFKCEVTGHHVCTKSVDEGFLRKQFFSYEQLNGLKMRGGSWGDKLGLLRRALTPSRSHGTVDACGCRSGVDGWSTTNQECRSTSTTSPREGIQCRRKSGNQDFDVCGCKRGSEGWSTTSGSCSASSRTSSEEAARCGRM